MLVLFEIHQLTLSKLKQRNLLIFIMRKASLFLEMFVENPLEQLWQLKIASNSYIKSVVLQLTSNADLSKFYEKIGAY